MPSYQPWKQSRPEWKGCTAEQWAASRCKTDDYIAPTMPKGSAPGKMWSFGVCQKGAVVRSSGAAFARRLDHAERHFRNKHPKEFDDANNAAEAVPAAACNLASFGFTISLGLAMLCVPLVISTCVWTVWTLAAVGPARKTLSTILMCGLGPLVLPLLSSIVLGIAWVAFSVLAAAAATLLPCVVLLSALYWGLVSAAEFRTRERRKPQDGAQDITFTEMLLAIFAAATSLAVTGPVVLLLTLIKSPLVLLGATVSASSQALGAIWKSRAGPFGSLLLLVLFALGFSVGVPCLAIAIALSALVKLVGCALWPGYVACGWLRTVGAKRRAVHEFGDLARGARRELSPEVRCVSWFPPAVIGVFGGRVGGGGGEWRVEVGRLAAKAGVESGAFERMWGAFFAAVEASGRRCLAEGLLTEDAILEAQPSLIVGLPSLVLFEAVVRSPPNDDALTLRDGTELTNSSRPRGAWADARWAELMRAKHKWQQHEARILSGLGSDALQRSRRALEAVLLAGGEDPTELSEKLAALVGPGEEELSGPERDVRQALYVAALACAGHAIFKRHCNDALQAVLSVD
ncbi:hypothetical protein EMIHUDRAFT_113136 [Emiliania huxleyi CCMP1516]|uniref:Uncharacterized protein n=2 Tax=Emiliania huxleyi TaxID=2903 RepID=A0A0D3K4P9_EMIH1|nr:hypothetical protein EMIHUDRAFT_113136 [Emiliania huxleyi CCMP1516]EOD30734.1 hypothetical protein EMIHUDRAFT_113136 [Emiliania huxleyi CCMP1516]|eukprot:XP_005783163.1 hypothetical protein EMIHUDRAFT_113136 [Emiliania huxleyi CCMP1516]